MIEQSKILSEISDKMFPLPRCTIRDNDEIKNLEIVKDKMWPIKKIKNSLVKTGEALYQLREDYHAPGSKEWRRRNVKTKIHLDAADFS